MVNFLTIGILLGLSAGLAPGPLLTLVISETLRHDIKSGVKVAIAPIITDLPIIALTFLVLAKLSNFHKILGLISLAGGFFILFMGYENIRSTGVEIYLSQEKKPNSLTKGIVVNALSPHPYLFWIFVGTPIMTRAMDLNIVAPLAFVAGFYTLLVGSKVILAILVGKSKSFLTGHIYIYTIRFLGLVLCILAFILFYDGLKLLEIV
ncbi:MAG: LysE family transporter [Candidatus Competibacteraceae bacterium]